MNKLFVVVLFVLSMIPASVSAATTSDIVTTSEVGTAGRVQVNWSWIKSTDMNLVKYRFRCSTINIAPFPVFTEIPVNVPIAEKLILVMPLSLVPTYCCISTVNSMGLESLCSFPVTVLPAFLPPNMLQGVTAIILGLAP